MRVDERAAPRSAGRFNSLLSPAHPDFKRVCIGRPEPFSFDLRLTLPAPRR